MGKSVLLQVNSGGLQKFNASWKIRNGSWRSFGGFLAPSDRLTM